MTRGLNIHASVNLATHFLLKRCVSHFEHCSMSSHDATFLRCVKWGRRGLTSPFSQTLNSKFHKRYSFVTNPQSSKNESGTPILVISNICQSNISKTAKQNGLKICRNLIQRNTSALAKFQISRNYTLLDMVI